MMNEIHITTVDWVNGKALRDIRQQVFIDEQQVPADLEWDTQDESATHFLLYYQAQPAATARLLSDGHIGRVAVLAHYRGLGLGAAIMRHVMEYAQTSGMRELILSAQVHAAAFYRKLGFVCCSEEYEDAGIAHQDMCWQASDQLSAVATVELADIEFQSPGRFDISNPEFNRETVQPLAEGDAELHSVSGAIACEQVTTLVDQCRRRLRIYSPEQARWLFNQRGFIQACERLIARDPKTRIQILLQYVDKEFLQGRTLLSLVHRFPSLCEIRCQHPDLTKNKYVQMTTDSQGFFMLPDCRVREGFVRQYTPDQVKRWSSQFDELWASSQSDPAIRRFLL
tara:strand:- start:3394 stop:4413 length:1020 start_codon:yes stop_codon:yes gene_type:complete